MIIGGIGCSKTHTEWLVKLPIMVDAIDRALGGEDHLVLAEGVARWFCGSNGPLRILHTHAEETAVDSVARYGLSVAYEAIRQITVKQLLSIVTRESGPEPLDRSFSVTVGDHGKAIKPRSEMIVRQLQKSADLHRKHYESRGVTVADDIDIIAMIEQSSKSFYESEAPAVEPKTEEASLASRYATAFAKWVELHPHADEPCCEVDGHRLTLRDLANEVAQGTELGQDEVNLSIDRAYQALGEDGPEQLIRRFEVEAGEFEAAFRKR